MAGKAKNGNGNGKKKAGKVGQGKGQGRTNARRKFAVQMRENAGLQMAGGAMAVPTKAWSSQGVTTDFRHGFSALSPLHMPLPRAVGDYTVVRLTKRVTTAAYLNIIGPHWLENGTQPDRWTNVIMSSGPIGTSTSLASQFFNTSGTSHFVLPTDGTFGNGVTWCPSAISVQVVCPQGFSSASGAVYASVLKTQIADNFIGTDATTYAGIVNSVIAYQNPRNIPATKLTLRGITANSVPLNMSRVSEFTTTNQNRSDADQQTYGSLQVAGWAPIVIINTGGISATDAEDNITPANPTELEILITTEWRVRFPVTSVASASHRHYPVVSDSVWDKACTAASALGHGIRDISDTVAEFGGAVAGASALAAAIA